MENFLYFSLFADPCSLFPILTVSAYASDYCKPREGVFAFARSCNFRRIFLRVLVLSCFTNRCLRKKATHPRKNPYGAMLFLVYAVCPTILHYLIK